MFRGSRRLGCYQAVLALLVHLALVPVSLQRRLWGNAIRNPLAPSDREQETMATWVKQNARVLRGFAERGRVSAPCLPTSVTILVRTGSDVYKRLQYPPNYTVYLRLANNITLSTGLLLNSSFTCTIFYASSPVTLKYPGSDMPTITLANTSNILFLSVSIQHGISAASQPCPFWAFVVGDDDVGLRCPGVYIFNSYGVQIAQGSVFGRIDIFRSLYVLLDSLSITMPANSYSARLNYTDFRTHGVVRIGECSAGTLMTPSNIVVSNCEIYGNWELITLYRGAAGVTIRNNFFHDFLFTAVRCGADFASLMDCHLNVFAYNKMYNPPSWINSTTDVNNAGLYFASKWFNPANYVSCNYMYNMRQCYYLDAASSGIFIDGGVCVNTTTGLKVNNGKYVYANSLLVVNSRQFLSFISCQTVNSTFNCFIFPTKSWEAVRKQYWNTAAINQAYPYMKDLCNPVPTQFRGAPCNPANQTVLTANQTGYCSGFAYGNSIMIYSYIPPPIINIKQYDPQKPPTSCNGLFSMPLLNNQSWVNVTANPGFRGPTTAPDGSAWFDYGLLPTSPIYATNPAFKSCPFPLAGPNAVAGPSYTAQFGIPEPASFQSVVNYNWFAFFVVAPSAAQAMTPELMRAGLWQK